MIKRRLPMPIELAGLTSHMARAESQEKEIAAIGRRYVEVQNDIDEAIGAHKDHVGDLEHFRDAWTRKVDSMVARPNGGDPLDGTKAGQSGQPGAGQERDQGKAQTSGADLTGEKVAVTIADVGSAETALDSKPEPEHLTVNGVSTAQ